MNPRHPQPAAPQYSHLFFTFFSDLIVLVLTSNIMDITCPCHHYSLLVIDDPDDAGDTGDTDDTGDIGDTDDTGEVMCWQVVIMRYLVRVLIVVAIISWS
jgi:hypothetical protein